MELSREQPPSPGSDSTDPRDQCPYSPPVDPSLSMSFSLSPETLRNTSTNLEEATGDLSRISSNGSTHPPNAPSATQGDQQAPTDSPSDAQATVPAAEKNSAAQEHEGLAPPLHDGLAPALGHERSDDSSGSGGYGHPRPPDPRFVYPGSNQRLPPGGQQQRPPYGGSPGYIAQMQAHANGMQG
eukprot:CAMPEP_0206249374 /NCGR_PEP_ID=MMETSP0047_2-20121206/20872_1 /ASSEMBLY_ACC=CAM_ASM_000192 /TAXON_ID=195065 /ORGANISM="Chroomonas mesostigmatica_cf, Strain CCMP1168" /LENGTH=183 /DNA_ID=CAMNT_0053675087 /DNA_START=72 /DNA_END=619 /DNA_ORIENTATION=-